MLARTQLPPLCRHHGAKSNRDKNRLLGTDGGVCDQVNTAKRSGVPYPHMIIGQRVRTGYSSCSLHAVSCNFML